MNYFLYAIIYLIVFYMGVTLFSYLYFVADSYAKGESITRRHSQCRGCGHEQMLRDVIPIYSRLRYQNRCRYCGERLPADEIVVELIGGALAASAFYIYGINAMTIFTFLVIGDLAEIALIDAKTGEIPVYLNVILLLSGIAGIWLMPELTIAERVVGLFSISVPMFILMLFGGFGGGDVKMMFASGFLLGWKGNIFAFLIGAVTGGIYAVVLLATGKKGRKECFAFGPFLAAGVFISLIDGCGDRIVTWYMDMIDKIISYY